MTSFCCRHRRVPAAAGVRRTREPNHVAETVLGDTGALVLDWRGLVAKWLMNLLPDANGDVQAACCREKDVEWLV
ncbi:unnamed protein product [Phytophthora fragariaefolia]|uniref:Unnamed protein product n=1 Tax=Phytophthora fragariaefolia TaxID=1490495 RepID=A0A9W6XC09_9STRA|nr:unnamed protein product [Phytophthora fragariaefolia]